MTARLTSIVAVDQNGAIGCRNSLPWKLQSDMAFFRATTTGHTVIMGRKTFDSIGQPLSKRKNVVLSHNSTLFPSTPDCQLALSIGECLARAHQNRSREIFIIGGAQTYLEFAHLVDRYLVTVVDHEAEDADAFLADDIRQEIGGWETEKLASFPATAGKDQFGFKIFEVEAPDVDDRIDTRQRLAAKYLIKKQKSIGARLGSGASDFTASQDAFAF